MSYHELWSRLAKVYDEGEAKAIARMVYEVRYGLSLSDLLMGRDSEVPQDELEEIARRLEQQEPVQYVLGETEFCGHPFFVNQHVLIPRPETAELCRWIVEDEKLKIKNEKIKGEYGEFNILDIGTGSGCIAVTLAAEIPEAEVTAWDISAEALEVARANAIRNNVKVKFEQVDILNSPHSSFLIPHSSLIVSNPPYICNKERMTMEQNVLNYEPHTALFVPDDDPLLFYRAIATYALTALKEGGWLYFEINPLYAEPLADMLSAMSFHGIETKRDQYGKQRMIKAQR